METALIVVSVIGGGFIAILLAFLFVVKNHKEKKAATNASSPVQTSSQVTSPPDDVLTKLKKRIEKIQEKDSFFPVLLALGFVGAIWLMADGLVWWSFFVNNGRGVWVLLAVLITGTIVYPKKAVPVLFVLLLISLGCYFGPKMTVAREGPKSTAQVGFFDGEMQLKAGQWSETIFIKNGFKWSGPKGIPCSVLINGLKVIPFNSNEYKTIPLSEGIVKSIQFKYPIDTTIIFTQLTK
ncbi:MAG TPA: hypothetical protein PLB51_01280 [Candidatus Paceibacterota bacterium]|nr:hypothetical protein [Candidatus Paceibacterota bacterium]